MRFVALALAGLLTLLAASPAMAKVVFKSQMICDTDGAAPFTDKTGSVSIADTGDVKVKIKGLRPSTEYTCLLNCGVTGESTACLTDEKGSLNVTLEGLGRQGSLADGCGFPTVSVFTNDPDDDGDFCQTGYGFASTPP